MKRSKFNAYRYCKGPRGWHYYKVPTSPNGKLKPALCVFGGQEFEAGGKFYIPIKGQWVLVGETAVEAQLARTKLLAKQTYEKTTGEVLETSMPNPPASRAARRSRNTLQTSPRRGRTPRQSGPTAVRSMGSRANPKSNSSSKSTSRTSLTSWGGSGSSLFLNASTTG